MLASSWNDTTVDIIGVDPSQPCMATMLKILHQDFRDMSGIWKIRPWDKHLLETPHGRNSW